MARLCQGCGGVLGRDCFNEQDCMSITDSQTQQEIWDLKNQVSILIDTLNQHNIPVPNFLPIQEETNCNYPDGLPF